MPDQDIAVIKEKLEKLIHNLKNEIAVLRRCCEALEEEIAKGPNLANFAVIMKYTSLMKNVTGVPGDALAAAQAADRDLRGADGRQLGDPPRRRRERDDAGVHPAPPHRPGTRICRSSNRMPEGWREGEVSSGGAKRGRLEVRSDRTPQATETAGTTATLVPAPEARGGAARDARRDDLPGGRPAGRARARRHEPRPGRHAAPLDEREAALARGDGAGARRLHRGLPRRRGRRATSPRRPGGRSRASPATPSARRTAPPTPCSRCRSPTSRRTTRRSSWPR